ncbi:hypothetical protein Tco_0492841 [Tanacetum coccineum]
MASFDYRLNPLYAIRECSSCGALYNKSCGCSKGGLIDKFVRDPNKTPDSSQRPPIVCVKCGNPVEGPSCQGCALWRKKLKEVWFTTCHENGINQDLLNTSESSDDDTNVVNAPREPFVVKQDPGENSSQSPPQINHNCCYECGESLDGIFCQQCTCKSCGKGAHIGYNCPPKARLSQSGPCNQTIDELPQTLPSFDPTCCSEKENSLPYVSKPNFIPVCYDDDDDEESSIPLKDIISELPPCVAITPDSPKTNSLIMEDEHLDTIPETESGECDLPPYDDSSKNHDLTFSNPLFDIDEDFTSSDESFSEEDVPNENFKIFSNPLFDLDEEITSTKVDQIDDEIDSLLDEFVGELTLLKSIPPGIDDDNLDPEGEIHLVERLLYATESFSPSPIRSRLRVSLMEDDTFFCDGDIYNTRIHPLIGGRHPFDVPNFLPPPICPFIWNSNYSFNNDLGSDLDVSSPSGDSNKIYDTGICIEVNHGNSCPLSPVIVTKSTDVDSWRVNTPKIWVFVIPTSLPLDNLTYEVKENGEKVVDKKLLVSLKGELYFVDFIVNTEEDDVEPWTFSYYQPTQTQEELTREELEEDLYERIMLFFERRPIIETLKYGDKHKKLFDSVLLEKLKLDGEFEVEEEMCSKPSAINGFDMPLPVAVCSGLVNPLAPRKGKFHGGLITISTLCA